MRRFAKDGAEFLVNITNDAWFGSTAAPYQHLSMAALRAVENRRFVARAANTGISAIIAASGRIVQQSKLFTPASLTGIILKEKELTFYSRFGDIFAAAVPAAERISTGHHDYQGDKDGKNNINHIYGRITMPSQWEEKISSLEQRMETLRGYL